MDALITSHIDLCIGLLGDLLLQPPTQYLNEMFLEGLVVASESLLSYCVEFCISSGYASAMGDVVTLVSEMSQMIFNKIQLDHTQPRGRPKIAITQDQILQLIHCNFSVQDIANLLQCSTKTVYRLIEEFGLNM